jgi:hypothetical protein
VRLTARALFEIHAARILEAGEERPVQFGGVDVETGRVRSRADSLIDRDHRQVLPQQSVDLCVQVVTRLWIGELDRLTRKGHT